MKSMLDRRDKYNQLSDRIMDKSAVIHYAIDDLSHDKIESSKVYIGLKFISGGDEYYYSNVGGETLDSFLESIYGFIIEGRLRNIIMWNPNNSNYGLTYLLNKFCSNEDKREDSDVMLSVIRGVVETHSIETSLIDIFGDNIFKTGKRKPWCKKDKTLKGLSRLYTAMELNGLCDDKILSGSKEKILMSCGNETNQKIHDSIRGKVGVIYSLALKINNDNLKTDKMKYDLSVDGVRMRISESYLFIYIYTVFLFIVQVLIAELFANIVKSFFNG